MIKICKYTLLDPASFFLQFDTLAESIIHSPYQNTKKEKSLSRPSLLCGTTGYIVLVNKANQTLLFIGYPQNVSTPVVGSARLLLTGF